MITPPTNLAAELKSDTPPDRELTMLPGQPITPAKFAELSRRFFPTPGQVAYLLEHFTISKKMPKLMLAELMGVSYAKVEAMKMNPDAATRSAVRILWCLYQLDVQPQCLVDMFHWATWGQIDVELPVKKHLNGNEVSKVKAILRRFKEQGFYGGLPMVIEMVQKECGILLMRRKAWLLCREVGLGYEKEPAGAEFQAKVFGRKFGPHSPYLNMDWRKPNPELARQFGMKTVTVEKVRAELEAMNPKRLADYLRRCGKNPEWWETIILKSAPCKGENKTT